jgi:hypothetical protein
VQGRRIELMYIFYYTESYGAFDMALQMAENARATDVVANFGVWMAAEPPNTTCGDVPSAFPAASICPNMRLVCDRFTGGQGPLGVENGQEDARFKNFRLFWAATTPARDENTGTLQQLIPEGHNLNVPEVCRCAVRSMLLFDFSNGHL